MKIDIWKLRIPSYYKGLEDLQKVIGKSSVKAYSIDEQNNEIVEGHGSIKSNESYNYHNNYDNSKDCMWFNSEQKWFTLNYEEVLEVQRLNNIIIKDTLEPILEKVKQNI